MRTTEIALGAVAVGFWLFSWIVGWISPRLQYPLAITSTILGWIAAHAEFAFIAARAALDGGYYWIAFAVFLLLALAGFLRTGVLIWAWTTGRLDDAEPVSGS
jgi:hypothetical protein